MSELEQNHFTFDDTDLSHVSTSWVYKLNKQSRTNELSRRNLITTGLLTDLRTRLLKYLRGKSTQADFEDSIIKNTFIPGIK